MNKKLSEYLNNDEYAEEIKNLAFVCLKKSTAISVEKQRIKDAKVLQPEV